jgi:hypothetical protein
MLGINADDLPLEGVPGEAAGKAKGAMGVAGLKFGEVAYLDKLSDGDLAQLKAFFEDTIQSEIDALLADAVAVPSKRRPSHREAGRRASDTLLMEQAAKRASMVSDGRASIFGLSIPDEVLDLADEDED